MKAAARGRYGAPAILALVVALLGVTLAHGATATAGAPRPRGDEGAAVVRRARKFAQPVATPSASSASAATPPAAAESVPGTVALTSDAPLGGYLSGTYTAGAGGMSMTFYLHVPTPIDPRRLYPLVLLLHGGGERGSISAIAAQNRALLLSQPYVEAWTSAAVQRPWPSFVVVPQLVNAEYWVNVPPSHGSYSLASAPTPSLTSAKGIVDALHHEYPDIDATRIYVTGISIGAYGVWDASERWPAYFAAAAPLAGAGDPSHAAALVHVPLWAFAGADDGVVPVSGSRDMIQAIEAAGGHPRYTEFASATHDIWIRVYSAPDFLAWLFDQRNGAITTPSPQVGGSGPR